MPDWISRRVKVARTRAWHRWKAAPPFGGGASASRFSSTLLSKDIHRKRSAPRCTSVKTPYPRQLGYSQQHMWCPTGYLGGWRSHGLGLGTVGKLFLPLGGVRLPPVSLAPCCQKISTKNGLTITITLTLTITITLTLPNHNPDPNPKLTLHIYRPTHPNRL
jgi:hypothetical protein